MVSTYQFKVIFSLTLVIVQCSMYVGANPKTRYVRDLSEEKTETEKTDNVDDLSTAELANDEAESTQPITSDIESDIDFLRSQNRFVISENTPAWIAHRNSSYYGVNYTKLPENRVKQAVDDFKSARASVNQSPEVRKNVITKAKDILSSVSDQLRPLKQSAPASDGAVNTPKQLVDGLKGVFHLSLFVVMDFEGDWPQNKADEEKLINERIVYASVFWTEISRELSDLLGYHVHVTISGIAIGKNREATPYVFGNVKWDGLHMKDAFKSKIRYWQDMEKNCNEFPLSGYHVVVTMTSSKAPMIGYSHAKSSFASSCEVLRTGKEIGGVIFSDDGNFGGLPIALREVLHVLGAQKRDKKSKDCPAQPDDIMVRGSHKVGTRLGSCALNEIITWLNTHDSCLKKSREFQPSGKPIEPIFMGQFIPLSEQCEQHGLTYSSKCSKEVSCERVICTNKLLFNRCVDIGAALQGTEINNKQMCLNGKIIPVISESDSAVA